MFVVDDLLAWLVGRLADAGYRKLIVRVRGSDLDRALREAVTAAVKAAAEQTGPAGREQAERVAAQINAAFRGWTHVPLPPGQCTLLEALQSGIAAQLSALDSGQTAGNLGPPASVVADGLTGHLLREILIRGAQGGPLTALASQLNDDLTHLQGQRIEGMLTQLLDRLPCGLAGGRAIIGSSGQPLASVRDPFALEVHRPVKPDVPQPGLPALPVYVPREHDSALAGVVMAAAAGTSGIAVLVGESSTGKTRACWQVLEVLRELEPGWRLWHPIDPSRPEAALAMLPDVGPRTVVWLNEAQDYLRTAGGAGERVAAGLRELLRNQDRGPVLVLATLWPQFWAELTVRPSGAEDPHAQARELLAGHDIAVPAVFPAARLRDLQDAGDPRLAQAAAGSRDGQVIQYLAGAPELLTRYLHAPPAARALIHTAMDARRLGMGTVLPLAFLEAAAPGYLTDTEWGQVRDDWLAKALNYAAEPAKGGAGPLSRIRPRLAPGIPASTTSQPSWQLADYLDQQGRRIHREEIPPQAFWAAAATLADPADLLALAEAAERRGLSRNAALLFKQGSARGDPKAGASLVRLLRDVHPGDQRPSDWAAAHASLDDPTALVRLLKALREAGANDAVTVLLDRDPAAHVSLDDPRAVAELLRVLHEAGAKDQVAALLARDPATHARVNENSFTGASRFNPSPFARLLGALREAGADGQVTALASRAVARTSLDDPLVVAGLLDALREAGADGQVTALLARNPAIHASLDDPAAVASLMRALYAAAAGGQATALASRVAAQTSLDDPVAVNRLLWALLWTGGRQALLARDPAAHVSLDDPKGVATLLATLGQVGETGQVAGLLARDPAIHASLDDPAAVASLLWALHQAGATGQVAGLLARDPATHASLDDPRAVAELLRILHEAGAKGQVAGLLARDPATHASLDKNSFTWATHDNPPPVARLLKALRNARADGQVTTLASRAVAQTSLDDPLAVAGLLRALHQAGAKGQVAGLLARDPATHASLDDPRGAAELLRALHEAKADGQVTALARRAVAQTSLDDPRAVDVLLHALLYTGQTRAHAAELIERLPAAGQFDFFCRPEDHLGLPSLRPRAALPTAEGRARRFRFGREADGRPADPWAWTDEQVVRQEVSLG